MDFLGAKIGGKYGESSSSLQRHKPARQGFQGCWQACMTVHAGHYREQ
jgi:hypothetical protein